MTMDSLLRAENFPAPTGEKVAEDLKKALSQLEQLEKKVTAETDISKQRKLASEFDDQYPVFTVYPDGSGRRISYLTYPTPIQRSTIQRERTAATEVLQNSSIENRYDAVFAYLDTELPKLDPDPRTRLPHLKSLKWTCPQPWTTRGWKIQLHRTAAWPGLPANR